MKRRQFLQLSGVVGSMLAAPAIWTSARAQSRQVVFCSWGGAYQKALREAIFDPFEKETGIKVIDTTAPAIAQVKSQVDTGNIEWDVIEGGSRWYPVLVKMGLVESLESMDFNPDGIVPGAVLSHGLAPTLVSFTLGYNTQRAGTDGARNWADFWDVQKYPGARSLGADVTYNLEFALLADGVAVDALYPLDVERAFRKLEEIRPHIRTWWKQGDQPVQMLSRGEVVYSSGWASRFLLAGSQGLPVGNSWEQGSFSPSFFMVMSGAKHKPEAHELIRYAMQADPQAAVAKLIPVGVSNEAVHQMLPAEVLQGMPTAEDNFRQQWPLQGEWLAEHYDAVNDRWQKFMLG
ncbi:ABC transporter substrate-binding protein [Pseudochelatococcus sp. B33]